MRRAFVILATLGILGSADPTVAAAEPGGAKLAYKLDAAGKCNAPNGKLVNPELCKATPSKAPLSIAALSTAERASLPDETVVRLTHGRVVSLGVLRAEHSARIARFADSRRGLPPEIRARAVRFGAGGPRGPVSSGGALTVNPGAPAPPKGMHMIPFSLGTSARSGLAPDLVAFCKGWSTGCLYVPPNTYLANVGEGYFMDQDPIIANASICKSQGGLWNDNDRSCYFYYPDGTQIDFPVSPVQPTTDASDCSPNSDVYHFGFVWDTGQSVLYVNASKLPQDLGDHPLEIKTGGQAAWCVVRVYVPN
jgi:hypothetical protein